MALVNKTGAILAALQAIQEVKAFTQGWPANYATVPCIVVSEASNTPAGFYDDRITLNELVYDVRVFDKIIERKDRVASAADSIMLGLGYTRVLVYDDNDADVRMKVMRYKIYEQEENE